MASNLMAIKVEKIDRCHMYEVKINQTGLGNKVDSWAWAPEWLVFPLLSRSISICRHLCT